MFSKYKKQFLWTIVLLVTAIIAYFLFRNAIIQPDGDDLWFRTETANMRITDYLAMRYRTWTGRMPIEFMLVSFLKRSIIYWHILGVISIMTMGFGVSQIFKYFFQPKKNLYASLFFYIVGLTLPLATWFFSDSGCVKPVYIPEYTCSVTGTGLYWYSGFFNYFLPFSLLFLMIGLLLNLIESEHQNWKIGLLIIGVGFYATAAEQVAILWTLFSFFSLFLYIIKFSGKQRRVVTIKQLIRTPIFYCYILTGIFILLFLTAPGNRVRLEQEIARLLPVFSQFTLFDKLQLGLGYGLEVLSKHMLFMFICMFICSAIIFIIKKERINLITSIIGIVITGLTLFFYFNNKEYSLIKIVSTDNKVILDWYISVLLLIIVLLLLLVYVCVAVFQKKKQKYLVLFFFFTAICNSIFIGLSPTIYGSGIRTQYLSILIYTLIFLFLLLETGYQFVKNIR